MTGLTLQSYWPDYTQLCKDEEQTKMLPEQAGTTAKALESAYYCSQFKMHRRVAINVTPTVSLSRLTSSSYTQQLRRATLQTSPAKKGEG